jgi:ribbon-helix-helix CopG family protein
MKGITIKLPEATLRRLKAEARATGRTVASLVRERVETPVAEAPGSVWARSSDLAGSVAGSRRPATNDRRRFRRP